MTELQYEAYKDATSIKSDPFGLINRDNRNHRKKQRIILDTVNAGRGDPVLEVGCGHGLHARGYAERFDYHGIDISPSLAEETRTKIDGQGDVYAGDAADLPFPDNEFEAVVGAAILHHLPDQEAAIREWTRVVRPGGSVTLMEPNPLFPKDFVQSLTIPEEQHVRNVVFWRLRRALQSVPVDRWTIEPRIYTLPWPAAAHGLYDRIDDAARRVPGFRWMGQMQLVHIEI